MWINYLGIVILMMIVLSIIFQLCGAWVREKPQWLFVLGFITTCSGVVLLQALHFATEVTKSICAKLVDSPLCNFPHSVSVASEKVVEIGLAALGVALMALAVDISSKRSQDKIRRDHRREFSRWEQDNHEWGNDFTILGDELEARPAQEIVERYRELRKRRLTLIERRGDLRKKYEKWAETISPEGPS
jgi:hypothetical protein